MLFKRPQVWKTAHAVNGGERGRRRRRRSSCKTTTDIVSQFLCASITAAADTRRGMQFDISIEHDTFIFDWKIKEEEEEKPRRSHRRRRRWRPKHLLLFSPSILLLLSFFFVLCLFLSFFFLFIIIQTITNCPFSYPSSFSSIPTKTVQFHLLLFLCARSTGQKPLSYLYLPRLCAVLCAARQEEDREGYRFQAIENMRLRGKATAAAAASVS